MWSMGPLARCSGESSDQDWEQVILDWGDTSCLLEL